MPMPEPELPEPDYENLEKHFPFPSFRFGQDLVLEEIKKGLQDPEIKYIFLEAATGLGKSGIAIAAAKASLSAYISTANKFLQDQYNMDFSDYMKVMKGRENYACHTYKGSNCANSTCRKTNRGRGACAKSKACEYHHKLDAAKSSSVTCFNFAAFLPFLNSTDHFKKRNIHVLDEAHNLENWITGHASLVLKRKNLLDLMLALGIPDFEHLSYYYSQGGEDAVKVNTPNSKPCELCGNTMWKDGSMFICQDESQCGGKEPVSNATIKGFIGSINARIIEIMDDDAAFEALPDRHRREIELLSNQIGTFIKLSSSNPDNFVIEKRFDKRDSTMIDEIEFKPIDVSAIVNDCVFRHTKKVILMSATILDFQTFSEILGVDQRKLKIIRVGSNFPVENRRIHYSSSVPPLNKDNLRLNLAQIVKECDRIINMYPDKKGIIHGTSYFICNFLENFLENRGRLLYPKKAADQKSMLDKHFKSKKPTILLSPSMTEGVDLKGEAAEFQILIKVPYPYFGDPVIRGRIGLYPNYYALKTALALVQAYGRGNRSETDVCTAHLIEGGFGPFIFKNRSIMPGWFLEATPDGGLR